MISGPVRLKDHVQITRQFIHDLNRRTSNKLGTILNTKI